MNSKTRLLLLAASALIAAATFAVAAHHRRQPTLLPNVADATGRTTLPNGWRLTPAGHTIPLPGDMPLGMSLTPDGRYLLVNTGGFHDHSVNVIDLKTETLAQSVNVYRNWGGLSTDRAGANVYVAGAGNAGANYAVDMIKQGISASDAANLSKPVYRLTFADGKLTLVQGVDIDGVGAGRFMGGLLCGPAGSLYALNINADTVYKLAGSPMHVVAQAKVGYRPGAVVLSPDGAVLAVSNWGDRSVSLLDAATLKETARVAVGSHPNALLYGRDGRLYVANAGSNSVSVLAGERVLETIVTSLEAKAPVGSTPDALALSPDGTRLYVANADNNAVAVIDTSRYDRARGQSESRVLGFIPTGWYPSALAVSQDGRKLYIGIGKGLKFRANYPGVVNNRPRRRTGRPAYDYIGSVLSGAVAVVDLPDARGLAAYTRQTRENLPLPLSTQVDRRQVEDVTHNAFAHIKHVLYIIRENRTYDQVFGDIPGGNGDPNLTMYGEQVTPNAHALARKTVLLDNLYCSGEVSEDGHEWCNAAYATDFREKGWINSYSGRGEPDADGRLTQSPAGYLWDNCARHGLSYRSYGEFTGYTASLCGRLHSGAERGGEDR
jgi:YVTN family beta-propeller protein